MSPRAQRLKRLAASLSKFGLVGLIGFVVDAATFNILRHTVLDPATISSGPIIAKFISTTLAIFANWIGNRNWTFRQHRSEKSRREAVEFFVVSIATLPVSLICLWFSRNVLGYTSSLADNISSLIIGTILGSVIRYVLYKYWVFSPSRTGRIIPTTTSEIHLAEMGQ